VACRLRGQDRPSPSVPSNLSVDVSAYDDGQIWVVRLAGDLDVTSSEQLRTAVVRALTRHPRMVVVDLSALDYADCSGLSVLVWAHRALASDRRQLCVAGSHGAVRRLMQITGADQTLVLVQAIPAPGE